VSKATVRHINRQQAGRTARETAGTTRRFCARLIVMALSLHCAGIGAAQEPGQVAPVATAAPAANTGTLGPGDLIGIRALHVGEFPTEPVRIDNDGFISLPLVGRVKAVGFTADQMAGRLRNRLDAFVRDPQVSVTVAELKSRPVSVLGAVKAPGVYQLPGPKRLLEVLAMAGGADQDAGSGVRVSRNMSAGTIPLPAATGNNGYSVVEISLVDLIEARRPEENFIILPDDVVSVTRARLVYVIGEVRKAGGFTLRERESMSVLQAISLAEGLTLTAGSKNTRIIRTNTRDGVKTEIPVDVKSILTGKAKDVPLLANDILFVPNSAPRSAAMRGMETAMQMATGVVIWRR
jgi:polysaccharide biosynthesis/export protein